MASRVNKKFVVILSAVLLAIAAGVALLAQQAMSYGRSAAQSVAQGDKFAAAGDWDKAVSFYGRAVNKERSNVEYITKWSEAIRKVTPATRQAYMDTYVQQYLPSLQAMAEAKREDVGAWRAMLEERYQRVLAGGGRGLTEWERFVADLERTLEDFRGDQAGRDALLRYRGLARSAMLSFNPELSATLVDAGIDDLSKALAVQPDDPEAVMALAGFEAAKARRLRASNDEAGAEQLSRSAVARLEKLAASESPKALTARVLLARQAIERGGAARDMQQFVQRFRDQAPAIRALADRIAGMEPAKVESAAALAVAGMMAAGLEDGPEQARAMLERLRPAKSDDPAFLLGYARFESGRGKADEAIALAGQVVALPNKPMGLEGVQLFQWRAEALRQQADAAFSGWDMTRDAEGKARYVKTAQEARAKLAEQLGEGSPLVLSADARLALMNNDFTGARTLATRYNDQTNRLDPTMLVMEGELLRRAGSSGAARQTLQRVLELDRTNMRALISMAELEASENNFAEAARYATAASEFVPDNEELAERARRLRDFAGGRGDDKVLNCLKKAGEQAMGVGSDVLAAEATLAACLKENPTDARLIAALAQLKIGLGKPEEARTIIEEALAKKPDDPALKRMKDAIETRDPVAAGEQAIAASDAPELNKALARVQLYRQFGRTAEAEAALKDAVRLGPDDPAVLELQFVEAMLKKDSATLARLVRTAEERNLDRVGGLIYRARMEIAESRLADAAATLRSVIEKDKLNLSAWRLLGLVRIDEGRFVDAEEALERAIDIKPDDLASIIPYIRSLVQQNKLGRALEAARKSEKVGAGNSEFVEMFLQLEASAPGGNVQRAIDSRRRLNSVVKIDTPQGRTNRAQLASLLINDEKFDEAKALIDELRRTEPSDPVGVELQAGLAGRRGDVAGAVKIYKDFIAGLPEAQRQPLLFINASRLLLQLGQPGEAMRMLGDGRAYQKPETMLIDRELGDVHFNLDQYAEAIAAYRRVLDAGVADNGNLLRKRILEALLKQRDAAGFETELAKIPADRRDATVLLLAAESAVQAGDRDKARRLYDQAVTADPRNPLVFIKRADFNWDDPAMSKDVEADLEQVLRVQPNSTLGLVRLARFQRQNGRDDQAVATLRQAVGTDPDNETLRVGEIQTLVELGRLRDAAERTEEALKHFRNAPQWRIRAAGAWEAVRDWEKVVEHTTALWAGRPELDIGAMHARALIKSGRPADLNAAFNVLNTAPAVRGEQGPEIRMLRAQLMARQGRAAQAAAEIAAVIKQIDPANRGESAGFMAGLAEMYPKVEDRVAALAKLEQGGAFTGYVALLASATRLQDGTTKTQAISALEGLARSATDKRLQAAAWAALGTLAYQERDWDVALERFGKGLEADPDNIELNNNIAFILATRKNKGAEALPFAQKAVAAFPLSSGFRDTLGVSHLMAGDLPAADRELRRALNLAVNDTERAPIYIHMARLRHAQGNALDARRMLNQAQELALRVEAVRNAYDQDIKDVQALLDAR
jgi:tetratricopeptide (TPR) repeat protein